ncbi:MAG: efflux RND transporter periplasmic adaptor subunit [Gemmatirosa sp.]|nr:efflux RND transporter periplasmic adaptor subunit [Gemmatirosa sp.]
MRRSLIVSTVAACLTLASAACHSNGDEHRPPPAVPVRAVTVARIDAPITVAASGVVEPTQMVNVEAQTSGIVREVAFQQGDFVTAGQLLFRLDPGALNAAVAQARAVLARDAAQATAAQHDDERYSALAAKGYVTQSQAEQVHATALADAATVVADRAALQAALVNLGYATIRAPIAGRTGSLRVLRGNLVGPSTGPLVAINQLRPIQVRFPVLTQDFDLLRAAVASRALPVIATTGDSANVSEYGTLSFLDNAIDSLTGTVTGRAVFANTQRRLWPGQLVFLTVQAGTERGVLAVPTPAVQTGQQGAYVYIVDPQKQTATMRPIAAGRAVGEMTLVDRGLSVGDRVVTDGQSRLKPGARVAVVRGTGGDTAASSPVAGGAAPNGSLSTTTAGGEAAPSAGGGAPNGTTVAGVAAGAEGTVGGRAPAYQSAAAAQPNGANGTGAPLAGAAGRTTPPNGRASAASGNAPATPAMPGASGTTSPAGVVRPAAPTSSAPTGRP